MTRNTYLFAGIAILYVVTGMFYSWNLTLNILNLGILSAIMALGVNIQWGYAGLFSTGIMGSVALGGLAVVLVSGDPVPEGFSAGGPRIIGALLFAAHDPRAHQIFCNYSHHDRGFRDLPRLA
jgi:branched-chain amino acid transport system permease protein